MSRSRSARGGRRFRLGFATAGVAAALALTGCGYDPSTAGNQDAPQGSAPSVADEGVAEQRAAHLVADAEELLRAAEHVQSDGAVSGETKGAAGELRGILETQVGRLDADGGSSMISEQEIDAVLGASGARAEEAFGDLVRTHVPRLRTTWEGLIEAGEPDIADVARDSTERFKALEPRLVSLPGQ